MKKFILPAALVALFVSEQALACASHAYCDVTIEYQGAFVSTSETIRDSAVGAWRVYGCEILCKGELECMNDCKVEATYSEIRCDGWAPQGANLIVEVEYQGASALGIGRKEEAKEHACAILCKGDKTCGGDCNAKGEFKVIQFLNKIDPEQDVCAAEVTVAYRGSTATAAAIGGNKDTEAKALAKANACEILCKGAQACMKDCKAKGKVIKDAELDLCADYD